MSSTKPASGDLAVDGHLFVAANAALEGNVRCEGHARLDRAATVDGDLDVAGSLAVREGARIRGRVTCSEYVEWEPTASAAALRVDGPFRVDGHPIASSVEAAEGVGPALEEESA